MDVHPKEHRPDENVRSELRSFSSALHLRITARSQSAERQAVMKCIDGTTRSLQAMLKHNSGKPGLEYAYVIRCDDSFRRARTLTCL